MEQHIREDVFHPGINRDVKNNTTESNFKTPSKVNTLDKHKNEIGSLTDLSTFLINFSQGTL